MLLSFYNIISILYLNECYCQQNIQSKMNPRLLFVTDSLGMPREGVKYENTFFNKIDEEFPEVTLIDKSKRGRTTEDLRGLDQFERYDPDIVVTVLGIVDCAPRTFYKLEKEILSRTPDLFSKPYVSIFKSFRKSRPERCYVKPHVFERNLRHYYKRANKRDVPVISVKILPASNNFVHKSPDILEQISRYNSVYDQAAAQFGNVQLLAPFDSVEDIEKFFLDVEHPNKLGHCLIYQGLKPKLSNLVSRLNE